MSEYFGVLDTETDPFVAGRIPYPFAACIYFPSEPLILWEPNIIDKVIEALTHLNACTLWAHNGGKFDFHYLIEAAHPTNLRIQNGRIVQMQIGKVTLKDSWPLLPFALEEYKKDKINYAIFEKHRRNSKVNRERITRYLINDCKNLHELLTGFRSVVGPKDTIGSAAFYQMRELGLKIHKANEAHDDTFRPYYFGGRVEAFKKGIHKGQLIYLDITSAYPYAMKSNHPHGRDYLHGDRLPPRKKLGPCFVHCVANSRGALPLVADDGSLHFPHGTHEFYATGWEIAAGLETGTLDIERIIDVWMPTQFIGFGEYVDTFFGLRQMAKKTKDAIRRLAYKYLLNSGYGKFAQNPRNFRKYRLADFGVNVPGYEWERDFGAVSLWSKASPDPFGYYDVATGASITGFVRAFLWRAICKSRDVLYVDTDSMICRSTMAKIGENLGQWKIEGKVKTAAIAGKKLYAVEWRKPVDGERYKIASKGARLSFAEIVKLCNGKVVEWVSDAPSFSIAGDRFIRRKIRAT